MSATQTEIRVPDVAVHTATRTLESRTDRLLTMLVLPLTSCSARLPVYVLVTATVFAPGSKLPKERELAEQPGS